MIGPDLRHEPARPEDRHAGSRRRVRPGRGDAAPTGSGMAAVRWTTVALGALLLLAGAAAAQAPSGPAPARAKELVASKRTGEFITVREALAYAERMRPGVFKVERIRAERREAEPFTRVHLCYRLGPPAAGAATVCGIEYRVADDPPSIELSDENARFARPLQHSRARFLAAINRELRVLGDPIGQALERFADVTTP